VPLPNATDTKAWSINARGDIVGRYFVNGVGPHGFLRYGSGTFVTIDIPGVNGTVLRGNNASADAVGRYFDFSGGTHGFFRTTDGEFTLFDVTGGIAGTTVANAVNNLDQSVGMYDAPTSTPCGVFPLTHGFVRDRGGNFASIDFPGALITQASGIDDASTIVGTYITIVGSVNCANPLSTVITVHGFMRTARGQYLSVDAPPSTGAKHTLVEKINDAGEIVGTYLTNTLTAGDLGGDNIVSAPGDIHNFMLSGTGSFTPFDLTSIPGSLGGLPLGVNSRGSIVGVYSDGAHDHGFVGTR
jgi:hypothetical protein